MRTSILFLAAACVVATAALAASSSSRRDQQVLDRARQLQLEFRQGNHAAVGPLVATLEDAVVQSPNNAKLWEMLGFAQMSEQGSLISTPPDIPAMLAAGERALQAFDRSLALEGDNLLVHASHGMAKMVVSQLKGDVPGMLAGIEEMNAAVRANPESTALRLTRGFTIIHLPPGMRDTNAVIEDLQAILDTVPGGRYDDVLHVMLGDVYAETGDPESARAEYAQVVGASAFAAGQARSRLAALEKGAVDPADIAMVRMGTGARCHMCHAPGTDD
ncbi:MAG TPA: hypothetical protein VFP37_01085 [Steroidobacteraceae bacterium]|nr:hypothetical protein [Steroidobacteraceae bacterium]